MSQLASTWGALPTVTAAAPSAAKPAPIPTEDETTTTPQEAMSAAALTPEDVIPRAAVKPVTVTAVFPPAAFPAEAPEVAIEPLPYLRNMPLATKPKSSRVVPLEGPSDLAEADAIASQYSGSMSAKALQMAEEAADGLAQSPASAPAHASGASAAEEETMARRARLHAEKHVCSCRV